MLKKIKLVRSLFFKLKFALNIVLLGSLKAFKISIIEAFPFVKILNREINLLILKHICRSDIY
jgi:hypothetical protein